MRLPLPKHTWEQLDFASLDSAWTTAQVVGAVLNEWAEGNCQVPHLEAARERERRTRERLAAIRAKYSASTEAVTPPPPAVPTEGRGESRPL